MVPKADDKPEWKLNGQMFTYTLPLTDSVSTNVNLSHLADSVRTNVKSQPFS